MDLDLKNLLSNRKFSRKEKILLLLASGSDTEKPVKDIRSLAIQNGLSSITKWNISQLLKDLGSAVVKLPTGWSLTADGNDALNTLGISAPTPSKALQPTLRKYLIKISSSHVREFLEEVIGALELKLYRSAVVLSWVGAVSLLYELILSKHLKTFNAEATKRFPKWKDAKTTDDLARMKEYDFLQILYGLSIIGKNTKDELEQCLKLRNTCGHPNTHKVGEHRVASHLETLILNVYSIHAI